MDKQEVEKIKRKRPVKGVSDLGIEISMGYEVAKKRQLNVMVGYPAPEINTQDPSKTLIEGMVIRDTKENELYRLVQTQGEREEGVARRVYSNGRERRIVGIHNLRSSIRGAIEFYDAMYGAD